MNPDFEPYRTPEPTPLTPEQQNLITNFRTYLHVVMTAGQTGQTAELTTPPGPTLAGYGLDMAKLPQNRLAWELGKAVNSLTEAVFGAAFACSGSIDPVRAVDSVKQAEADPVLEQLDFALALFLRHLLPMARVRAKVSRSSDLILEVLHTLEGDGLDAGSLIRSYQERFPGEFSVPGDSCDHNSISYYAWTVYQHVKVLERMAEESPDLMLCSTRQMNSWPMLHYLHRNERERFDRVAARLELGKDYPLDASKNAKHRPETPMVIYLDDLVCQLHWIWEVTSAESYESVANEKARLAHLWREYPDPMPAENILELLMLLRRLQPLTKATSEQWSKTVVVPLILETDAQDWKACEKPALAQIARQRDVKSRATFKSRLLSSVSKTLKSLAREGK